MTHLSFEHISEIAERDGDADAATRSHLEQCAECRATLARVRDLVDTAARLPRAIEPPPEVWSALRARLGAERVLAPTRRHRWWHNGWLAAAAAVVLVAGTATLTTLIARGKAAKARTEMVSAPALPVAPAATAPVLLAVDRNYVATIRELRGALELQRARLSPATVRTLEHSLAVIDAAIVEARTALAADPANQALVDILSAHYAHEVDLLQRAAELSSSD